MAKYKVSFGASVKSIIVKARGEADALEKCWDMVEETNGGNEVTASAKLYNPDAEDITNAEHPARQLAIRIMEEIGGKACCIDKIDDVWFEVEDWVTKYLNNHKL